MRMFMACVVLSFVLTKTASSSSDLQEQNQNEYLHPVNDNQQENPDKQQDKRTVFSNHHGWAKHVGVHPAGFKYVLGYGPVELKYVPVVKPISVRPLHHHHHYHRLKLHVKPPLVVRPLLPVKPALHHDGWKPIVPVVKPVHVVQKPFHVHHVVKPVVPVKPVHTVLQPLPIQLPVKPAVPFHPVVSVKPVHVPVKPVVPIVPSKPLVPVPQPVVPIVPAVKPVQPVFDVFHQAPTGVFIHDVHDHHHHHFPVNQVPIAAHPVVVQAPAQPAVPVHVHPAHVHPVVPQHQHIHTIHSHVVPEPHVHSVHTHVVPQPPHLHPVQPHLHPELVPQPPHLHPVHTHVVPQPPHEHHDVQTPLIPQDHPLFHQQLPGHLHHLFQQIPQHSPEIFQQQLPHEHQVPIQDPQVFHQQLPNNHNPVFDQQVPLQQVPQEGPVLYHQQLPGGHVQHHFNQQIQHGDGASSNILLQGSIQPGHTDLQIPAHLPQHPNYLPSEEGRQFYPGNFHDPSQHPDVVRPSLGLEPPFNHK